MRFVRALSSVVVVAVSAVAAFAQEGLPPEVMQALKASTVYVKTEIGPISFTGSGFVMAQDGDNILIATNNHVVSKPKELQLGGYIPGLRGRDRITLSRLQAAMAKTQPAVTVVFNGGNPDEQALKAEITSGSDEPDLAILKVTGVKHKVTPFDYRNPPVLAETMSVYMLGFPFGDALATNKGNPAITVGKGSVSSIRKDASGKIVKVQIDGALNPGNSGGPVVDSKGGLVGIAVQTIQGSNIGLAIHPLELVSVLGGKVGPMTLTTTAKGKGKSTVEVTFTVNDPLSKLQGISFHFVPKAILLNTEQLDQPQVANAEGSQAIKPNREGNLARVELPVSPLADAVQISLQTSYVTEDGKTIYSPPQLAWVGAAADNSFTTITTVSNGESTVVTRLEQRGTSINRNSSVTRGAGAPPKIAEMLAKNTAKPSNASTQGGFKDNSPKTAKKTKDDVETTAQAKPKEKESADDDPAKAAETAVKWTNSIKKMVGKIPNAEVTGKLAGVEFTPDRIEFKGNTLTMRQGGEFFADLEISLVLFKQASELAGKKCVVNGQARAGDPHARLSVMPDGAKVPKTTPHLNYLLTLEFGEYDEDTRTLSGKIYICFPDKEKSVCAGTFDASVGN